jgi:hypothetical protein
VAFGATVGAAAARVRAGIINGVAVEVVEAEAASALVGLIGAERALVVDAMSSPDANTGTESQG